MMHYNASGSASLDKRKQRFGIKTVYKGLGVTVVEMAEALQRCEETDSKHQQIKLGSQPFPSPVPNTHRLIIRVCHPALLCRRARARAWSVCSLCRSSFCLVCLICKRIFSAFVPGTLTTEVAASVAAALAVAS